MAGCASYTLIIISMFLQASYYNTVALLDITSYKYVDLQSVLEQEKTFMFLKSLSVFFLSLRVSKYLGLLSERIRFLDICLNLFLSRVWALLIILMYILLALSGNIFLYYSLQYRDLTYFDYSIVKTLLLALRSHQFENYESSLTTYY